MSPRWQPPHPDPLKRIEPTPYSRRTADERRKREHQGEQGWGARCIWNGCTEYADYHLRVCLCLRHALHVTSKVTEHLDATQSEDDRREREHREARAMSAAKLDAGRDLEPGDPAPGWIYYIRIDDTIKIGYTSDLEQRIRQYPPNATLLALEPGTPKIERARHSLFHAHLAYGREWFKINTELDTWIQQLNVKHGDPSQHHYRLRTPDEKDRRVVASKRANRRR